MPKIAFVLSLAALLVAGLGCGSRQTRTDMAAERALQERDDRYEVVRVRETEVEAARTAVEEAEQMVLAAEEAEAVLTSHSPAAVEAACEILAATPAPAPGMEEVAEAEVVVEEEHFEEDH